MPCQPLATRQAIRWTESAPLVNRFGVWFDEQRSRVSPRSRLGENPIRPFSAAVSGRLDGTGGGQGQGNADGQ